MGIMLKIGSESNKYFLLEHCLKSEYSRAHKEGYLHFHDLDFQNITLNCLSENTKLVIQNNNDIIFTDFTYFNKYFHLDKKQEIINLNNFQILSLNGKFTKIYKVMRRWYDGDLYKLIINNGSELLATPEHLLTVNNNEVKSVKDINIKDKIKLTEYPSHIYQPLYEINLIDLFGPNNKIIIYNWQELVQKYNINNLFSINKFISLQDYFTIKNQLRIDEHDIRLIYQKSRYAATINAILPLTLELGKIIGYILSEGHVDNKKANVIFANTNNKLINDFINCFENCFPNIAYSVPEHDIKNTSPCTFVKIYSKIFSLLFNGILAYKTHSNNIHLPDWFKFANHNFIAGFLAAEIDGDGCVSTSTDIMVSIFSASENFIKDIINILALYNIHVKYEETHIKGSITKFANNIIGKRNYDQYRIRLLNKNINQLQQLLNNNCYKLLNFNHKFQKSFVGRIQKIEIQYYQGYVYDFETEDQHFSANGVSSHNCVQLNLHNLFKGGFSTGHGHLREPNSIRSYGSLACIAIQSSQNDFFGGQSINLFDFYMADGVRKSFKKAFKKNILIAGKTFLRGSDMFINYVDVIEDSKLPKYLDLNSLDLAIQDFIDHNDDDTYSTKVIRQCFNFAFKQACSDVEEETSQAMEAVIFNLNTMQSRAGSQVPFSSLNLGCDTTHEGRLITKKLLDALYKGLGHNETSIFPIVVFQLKSGINYNSSDPNYDLFKQAIKCSAKRLFPTYMNEDATYNAQYYDPKNKQTLCATMG